MSSNQRGLCVKGVSAMLDICLQILSVLGILFLALLALAVTVLLLVLFFPVTYRIAGEKREDGVCIRAKAIWLFGLFRILYRYPEPGRVTAKALWITVYDARVPAGGEAAGDSASGKKRKKKKADSAASGEKRESESGSGVAGEAVSGEGIHSPEERSDTIIGAEETSAERESRDPRENGNAEKGKISQKIEKIKYTIHSIYDKIKEIWENIKYYTELLQEEDTKQLFSDVWFRVYKILRNMRPRRLKADILFGTGSPDTTGYLYGAYCMASSGRGYGLAVTPDFERAVLEAEFDVAGHITVWVLLINLLRLILDRRLREFIGKIKTGKKDRLAA